MTKRLAKKQAAKVTDPPQLSDGPREPFAGVGLRIAAIALRHLEYHEIAPGVAAVQPSDPGKLDISMDVEGTIILRGPEFGEFMLQVTAAPDPTRKPIMVRAKFSVLLHREITIPDEDFKAWVNRLGVLVLFPYIREMISSVTARGVFGPLYLDPIDVNALLGTLNVDSVAQQHSR